jgi:hypothetical protein
MDGPAPNSRAAGGGSRGRSRRNTYSRGRMASVLLRPKKTKIVRVESHKAAKMHEKCGFHKAWTVVAGCTYPKCGGNARCLAGGTTAAMNSTLYTPRGPAIFVAAAPLPSYWEASHLCSYRFEAAFGLRYGARIPSAQRCPAAEITSRLPNSQSVFRRGHAI